MIVHVELNLANSNTYRPSPRSTRQCAQLVSDGAEAVRSLTGKSFSKPHKKVDTSMEIHDCDVFESRAWRDKLHEETLTVPTRS